MGIYDDLSKLDSQSPASNVSKKTTVQKTQKARNEIFQVDQPVSQSTNRPTHQSRYRETMPSREHDTTVSRHHDTIFEAVRKAVKEFGKEAATHRFTLDEKKAIADLVYTYKRKNIKTSENEITRIGVNYLLQDHKENGRMSILNRVIKALNG